MTVSVLCLFFTVPCFGLWSVSVAFTGYTQLHVVAELFIELFNVTVPEMYGTTYANAWKCTLESHL